LKKIKNFCFCPVSFPDIQFLSHHFWRKTEFFATIQFLAKRTQFFSAD
jgi:hypothetical protein